MCCQFIFFYLPYFPSNILSADIFIFWTATGDDINKPMYAAIITHVINIIYPEPASMDQNSFMPPTTWSQPLL